MIAFNDIPHIALSELSSEFSLDTKYYSDTNKVIVFYKNHRIILSENSSYILIDDQIYHLFSHIRFDNKDYLIPAKSFINILRNNNIINNLALDSSERLLLVNRPDYNIIDYQIIKKGNGYSIEITTTQDFNEKLLSISRSSNNWLSISIPSGSVDTTSFNSIHFFNPIVDVKTVQMDNILQLSFLLSIIPDDFDIYTESKKIIIRLDTAQRSNAEKIKQDKKKYIFDTVIIDPGHGGKDPGAIANGFREKDITLSIAHKIGDKLEKTLGVNVIYTREEDVFLSLKSRTEIANINNGDVFLSIHANSIENSPSTKGFETYLLRPGKTKDAIDIALRENSVIKEFENNINNYNTGSEFILASMEQNAYVKESEFLAREIQYQLSNSLKNKKLNRGIKQAGFQVLVGASMPNVLIEVGFLTNTTEAQNLSSKKYQDKIAQGIVNALIIYKNRYEQHIIE